MATWIYEARTIDGRIVRGTRDAADRRSALDALRSEGFFVSRIEARGAKTQPQPLRGRANPAASAATPGGIATAPSAASPVAAAPVAAAPAVTEPPRVERAPGEKRMPATRPLEPRPARPTFTPGEPAPPLSPPLSAPASAPLSAPLSAPASRPTFDPDLTPPSAPPLSPRIDPGVLRPMGQATSAPLVRQPFLRASSQDLSNFFRQLAALMHAGTGIGAALQTLAENAGNASLRSACAQMGRRAQAGEPLSQSMRAFPGLFSPLMVGITSAGERGGFLERSFERLADYSERDYNLDQSIKRETWYPKLIVFCAILIPGVVPLVLQGFGAFLAQVGPPLMLIALLFVAWKAWQFARPAIAASVENFKVGNFSPTKTYDEIKLVIPVIGKTARALASAKFCRALGALYSAGVGPSEAVRLGAQACGNRAVAERALATIPRLNAGEPLTQCMKETRVFNPLALQMMRVGEESGDLDTQLDKAADFLETNAETTIKQAVPVLGIVAFLCVAAYVGSIVVSAWTGYGNELNDIMNQ